MKRFSKILVAVLALCLLVGVLALAVSADTGVTGQFAVNGTGYNTWDEAVAAAGDTHTIYLNGEWTVGSTIVISSNTKLNLNGKTVNATAAPVFQVTGGAELVLEGEGTVNVTTAFVEASGTNTTVTVNADGAGNGIVINSTSAVTAFRIYDRAILNVSGVVTVNAESGTRYVIDARLNGSAKGAAKIDISRAKLSATGSAFTYFMYVDADVTINITDSELNVKNDGFLIYANNSACTTLDVTAWKNNDATNKDYTWKANAAANVEFDHALDVKITATNSKFVSCPTGTRAGTLMYVKAYMDAKFTNCSLYGDYRPIASSTRTWSGTAINQHQLLFTDCHFFKAPNSVKFEEFFHEGCNYKIVGGSYNPSVITIANNSCQYLALTDAEGNPTGQWLGGYADNLTTANYIVAVQAPTAAWTDATYFPGGVGSALNDATGSSWGEVNFYVDGTTYTLYRNYYSDKDKYNAFIEKMNSLTDAVIVVDGVGYASVAAANAKIVEGSVVELLADVTVPIELNYNNVKFIANGKTYPGFVSAAYTTVDYSAARGAIYSTPADESEIITIKYVYGGHTATKSVVKGTVVPEMTEEFPYTIEGNEITFVTGWNVPALDYSDADQLENGVVATPSLGSQILKFFANGKNFDTLEAAIAGANGATITIYEDEVTVASTIAIATNTKINLNGKTVTATAAPVFKVTGGAELVIEGEGTVNVTTAFVEASGTNTTATVNADGAGNGIVINSTGTNGVTAFRIYDSAILNVSGSVTVNAESGTRYVINAIKDAGTGAAEINISRAKLSAPTMTTSSRTYLINVDANVAITITDSELNVEDNGYVIYAKDAACSTLDVSEYRDAGAWKDGAASNVKFNQALNVKITATNSKFVSCPTNSLGGNMMYVAAYMDAKFTDCIFYCDFRPIISANSSGTSAVINQHQLLFTDCHFCKTPNAKGLQRLFMYGVNYKIEGGTLRGTTQFAQGSSKYLELADGKWVGGYANNITTESYISSIETPTGNYVDATYFPGDEQNFFDNTNKSCTHYVATYFYVDGTTYMLYRNYYSDDAAYQALVAKSNSLANAVIIVDGVGYASVAAANEKIVEGSVVELLTDVTEPIEINYNNVKFKANGKTYPGFVSAVYTTVDYSAARGAIYSTPADESEIFEITYTYNEVTDTQNAVLGTLLKAPAVFDPYKRILDKEAGKYAELTWTLTQGETVVVVTGNGTAYPVVTETKAVIVNWTNADGSEILDTDYYFPGESTVLDEFDGEKDVAIDYSPLYYSIMRTGWESADVKAATEGLDDAGTTHTIRAKMGKVSPDTFQGLKYNLSLYSNYVINIYVPKNIEGIDENSLTVSTVRDGSIGLVKFDAGTIGDVEYDKYGWMLGVADTSIHTYYIVYTVGGEQVQFPVNVGVPTYAEAVMEAYKTDESEKAELTKTLIVNMANYADKVLTASNSDKTTDGAKIYADIVNEYSAKYLARYNEFVGDKTVFKDGGSIYEQDVAKKQAIIDGIEDEVDKAAKIAANAAASEYISGFSFEFDTYEPAFLAKFSEKAINSELGIAKPLDEEGGTQYLMLGVHLYGGWYGAAGGSITTKVWAEKAGTKYGVNDDIWGENSSTDYEYFAKTSNGSWNDAKTDIRQNWFKIKDIRNVITFTVYTGSQGAESIETTCVGDVYYTFAEYVDFLLQNEDDNAAFIDAALALYAFSEASEAYKAAN